MRKIVAMFVLLGALLWSGSALAAERIDLYCIEMPWCCQITCAMIDVECCPYGTPSGPLMAEFLNANGDVLGTATFNGDWCCGETYGQLDQPVMSDDVCAIRLVKPDEACFDVVWASLKVYCDDRCKWKRVFKGDLWCWQPILVPAPEPAPPVMEPEPAPAPPPAPAAKPEPEPRFEMPEEEPAPEPEIIVVPGRG